MPKLTPTEASLALRQELTGTTETVHGVNKAPALVKQVQSMRVRDLAGMIRRYGRRLRLWHSGDPERALWTANRFHDTMGELRWLMAAKGDSSHGLHLAWAETGQQLLGSAKQALRATVRDTDDATAQRRAARTEVWTRQVMDGDEDGERNDRETLIPLTLAMDDWVGAIERAQADEIRDIMQHQAPAVHQRWREQADSLPELIDAESRGCSLNAQLQLSITRSWQQCRAAWTTGHTDLLRGENTARAISRLHQDLQRGWARAKADLAQAANPAARKAAMAEWRRAEAMENGVPRILGLAWARVKEPGEHGLVDILRATPPECNS